MEINANLIEKKKLSVKKVSQADRIPFGNDLVIPKNPCYGSVASQLQLSFFEGVILISD